MSIKMERRSYTVHMRLPKEILEGSTKWNGQMHQEMHEFKVFRVLEVAL
jgi:hypothetical protein